MPTPIAQIRNLGPATQAQFARAGLTTAEQLHALGAHDAYRRLLQAGIPPHFIGYYALHMGLQGRPWTDCKGDEKAALRVQFDALVLQTRAPGTASLDVALNLIGVIPRK